jgi:hypothetical protein
MQKGKRPDFIHTNFFVHIWTQPFNNTGKMFVKGQKKWLLLGMGFGTIFIFFCVFFVTVFLVNLKQNIGCTL